MTYHPVRTDREITDVSEIQNILKQGKFAVIALCRNNEPYIVTLNYGYDKKEHALYFHAALKGQKLDFLRVNPQVCATIILDGGYVPDKCDHPYTTLVLRGTLKEMETLEQKKYGLEILVRHLEDRADAMLERKMKSDESYAPLNILKLDINEISAKKGK